MTLAGRDLTIGYSDRVVGRGLNVALEQGEVLALLGPNGGGKTTLLKTLLGILGPQAGEVAIGGRALVGPDFPRLVPTAALLGGGYLLFIDTLARTAAPIEIPLGILTAVIGTPFFIWLLAGMQRTWS